jgi:hypothetical protein
MLTGPSGDGRITVSTSQVRDPANSATPAAAAQPMTATAISRFWLFITVPV